MSKVTTNVILTTNVVKRALGLTLDGAPAIAGHWQVDAAPWFDPLTGRHLGWRGRMRRPADSVDEPAAPPPASIAPDPIAEAARTYGLGEDTGVDLPGEASGNVASRSFKYQNWEEMKDTWCRNAEQGYPETRKTDPKLADYYTALDKENCTDGYQWRAGDALNAAIGQGDTTVTPLQMAMVYSAVANGGKVFQPQVAKGVVSASGEVVKEFEPVLKGRVDVPKSAIKFLKRSLPGVTTDGSGETPFLGFPLDQIPVASKTGSAQVTGDKASNSVQVKAAIGKSGALTGYHWGLTRKRAILGWEAGQVAGGEAA